MKLKDVKIDYEYLEADRKDTELNSFTWFDAIPARIERLWKRVYSRVHNKVK